MFKTEFSISPAAAWRLVALCELLDARILDEAERSAAAKTLFESGNEIGFDKLLDRREWFFDATVRRDAVVERVGTVDQDRDVVLGKCLGDVFDNRVAAAACFADKSFGSFSFIAKIQHLDDESDQEQQNDYCS